MTGAAGIERAVTGGFRSANAPETIVSLDKEDLKLQSPQLLSRIDTQLARVAELETKLGQPPKTPNNAPLPPLKG